MAATLSLVMCIMAFTACGVKPPDAVTSDGTNTEAKAKKGPTAGPMLFSLFSAFSEWNGISAPIFTGAIVPSFLGGGAFSIFLLKQFFSTIPKEVCEAAKIDGCSWFRIFLQILLLMQNQQCWLSQFFHLLAVGMTFLVR